MTALFTRTEPGKEVQLPLTVPRDAHPQASHDLSKDSEASVCVSQLH